MEKQFSSQQITTKQLSINKKIKSMTGFASDLGIGRGISFGLIHEDSSDIGLVVISHRTSKKSIWYIAEENESRTILKPTNISEREFNLRDWTITIWNT